ncbi:MAG: sensor histidine kinase, partial [Mycobacterium sp.]
MFSALSLGGLSMLVALVVGIAIGSRLAPRVAGRRQRVAVEWAGITVAQMLQRIAALSPLGTAVVDTHRDVVYRNDRADALGLVRERQLDDKAWAAARRALASGGDVEFDLLPDERAARLSVHGQARLLSEEDRRFAVVFVYDQSEYAR